MSTRAALSGLAILVSSLAFSASLRAESLPAVPAAEGMVALRAGFYRPLFVPPGETNAVPVKAFLLDRFPVTNGDFLEFVRAHPRWRRSEVKRLFADQNYLKHWSGDLELNDAAKTNQPVVWVSWFAAKAFAQWKGRRLPTVAEWEYAAAASPTRVDGDNDPEFQRALRHWYTTPSPAELSRVGAGLPNCFGLFDLHGVVWEWTSDFNSAIVTGDARGDTGLDRQLFCGAGSAGAKDPANFPAFMRYGFRSSLKADYTVHNLGFRCAKDL
jgi:formylglycine-generating enzyme required for sulfatase activity